MTITANAELLYDLHVAETAWADHQQRLRDGEVEPTSIRSEPACDRSCLKCDLDCAMLAACVRGVREAIGTTEIGKKTVH